MSKTKTNTTLQTADPASQAAINRQRMLGQQGAEFATSAPGSFFMGADPRSIQEQIAPFMNPYQSQVIDATRGEFDMLRGQASVGAREAATRAGAFGGARHGVAEANRISELDRAQTGLVSGLLSSGYENALGQGLAYSEYQRALQERMAQEPLWRRQQAMGFLNMGLGPTGQQTTQTEKGSTLGTLAGLGMTAAGLFTGGAPQALASFGGSMIPGASQVFSPPQFMQPGGMSGGPGANPLSRWGNPMTQLPGPNPLWRG